MAQSINEERDFRSAEAFGDYDDDEVYASPDSSVPESEDWPRRIAGIAVDTLCAILALGIAAIYVASRLFSVNSGQTHVDAETPSDNAMIVLGGMGLLSLAIMIGLIVWSFRF